MQKTYLQTTKYLQKNKMANGDMLTKMEIQL